MQNNDSQSSVFVLDFETFSLVYLPESGEIVSRFETAPHASGVESRDARQQPR